MVADEVEKRLIADEVATAEDGVTIAARSGPGDEPHAGPQRAAGLGVGGFITGAHDDAELFDAGTGSLLEDELEGGFRFTALVDQDLQREGALARVGGGDEGLANRHGAVAKKDRREWVG